MTRRLSFLAFLACTVSMFYCSYFFFPKWEKPATEATISWDVSGYYWYLPSIFIYKDLRHQKAKDEIINKYHPDNLEFQQAFLVNGNYVMKYSSGMAIMYFPFFTVANLLAKPLGYPQDGFSAPYQFAIQTGGLLVSLLGLWYFRKLLLRYYSDAVTAISLILLVFGTNYLNLSSIDSGLSHTWLFTIYVFLILSTIKFYERPNYGTAIIIGGLMGLATLTRPSEIIGCIIPLLWGIESFSRNSIMKQLIFLKKHRLKIVLAFICAASVFSIQIVYWKYTAGKWIVYSYGEQGFSFLSPHFVDYLFSYSTGWLMYTPMMFLAFIGIYPLIKRHKHWIALLTFFIINLYIVCSWDASYFGGRAMVQSYAVLMFPIAALVEVLMKRKWLSISFYPFVLLFIYMNFWFTYNAHAKNGLLDNQTNNEHYFWRVLGRWHISPEINKLKDTDEIFEGNKKGLQIIYKNNYTDTSLIANDTIINGRHCLYIGPPGHNPSSGWDKFKFTNTRNDQWLQLEATITGDKEWNVWGMREFIVRFLHKGEVIKERMIRLDRYFSANGNANIYFDVKIPQAPFDSVGISFWNPGSNGTLFIDSFRVSSFNE